jgi:FAD/FMN-containing dehydrogenase
MNPAVLDAAALAIVAANTSAAPGVPGREPDASKGQIAKARVDEAMRALRAVAPRAGSYVNETDYFEPDWQRAFWGNNYARLLAIKHSVDPDGFFTCHHCVGSEAAPAASGISRAP